MVIFDLSQAMCRKINGNEPRPIEPNPNMTMGPFQVA